MHTSTAKSAQLRTMFKRHLVPYVVDGEAVYLASERGVSVVDGRLAGALAPLLDGSRTADEIATELSADWSPERTRRALDTLVRGGWACHSEPALDRAAAAYVEMAGLDADRALAGIRQGVVHVEEYGGADATAVVDALRAAGVGTVTSTGETPAADALIVAVTSDYLEPALAERNASALANGEPWLLARISGAVLWVGPFFVPGSSGCWTCLAHRLSANRQALSYLQQRLGADSPLAPTVAWLPSTLSTGAGLVATEVAKWLAGIRPDVTSVVTLDTVSARTEQHELVRRPQCASCGDAELLARRGTEPVEFASRPKSFTSDGGHRATSPEEMLERYSRQLSPVTGAVTGLVRTTTAPDGLRVYVAGQNLARQVRDLRSLRTGLRSLSCGKGMTDAQARASALGEAMERYSGVFQNDEARRRTSYDRLGGDAVDLSSCLLFSEKQYAERDTWNARGSMFNVVPERFERDAEIEWSPVWSMSEQRTKWLPTSYLYYGYPHDRFFALADSNGNAAGTSLEDAALQGFLELVERDSVALWWYNRVQRPAVDLDAFGDPYIDRLRETYRALDREVWALDLTSDFGIPAIGAFSRRLDRPSEDILIAFGAHLDPRIAVLRALTEMNQFLPSVLSVDTTGDYGVADPDQRRWWQSATVANQPYLLPDPAAQPSTPASWSALANDDLRDDLRLAQRLVEERGMEMLVLDQTRPDVGLPVAKVIVPGMRHFWARFAPGRLYDIPVGLGWLDAPRSEDELNPIPIFI